jgi:hypothetical protein
MYAFVTTSAAIEADGVPRLLIVGDVWDASDPVVKAHPSFFSDAPEKVHRSVAEKPATAKKTAAKKGA